MNLTELLKKWVVENCEVKEDASDDDFRKAAADALVDGKLTTDKYTELTKEKDDDKVSEIDKKFDRIADAIEGLAKASTPKEETPKPKEKEETPLETKAKETPKPKEKTPEPSRMAKAVAAMGGTPTELGGKDIDARVKEAAESYTTTKSALMYPDRTEKDHPHSFAGKRVTNQGRALDESSELDKALSGVWTKFQIMARTPRIAGSAQRAWELMSDHEKGLLCHLTEKTDWDNSKDDHPAIMRGYPGGIKALIDDDTSGGIEAAPIVFDDDVIQTPLLHGELYPLVNEKPLSRGRRIEGVVTETVTSSWGGVDDTSISLFTTTSYVTAFNTTVFRWEGSIKIGLDFLSDTPIDFNAHVTAQYGQRLLEDLDDVIATGDGSTQPEGITNSSATSVNFSGTTTLGAYETLRFSVAKPEHSQAVKNTAVFCGTETSYQRAHAIPVGASDVRRIGGMEYDSYRWMQRPYKINESLSNQEIFYAILGRYRMYRRKGFTVRTSTEGDTLIRDNSLLIVVMARYGGQLERGAAAGLVADAPS